MQNRYKIGDKVLYDGNIVYIKKVSLVNDVNGCFYIYSLNGYANSVNEEELCPQLFNRFDIHRRFHEMFKHKPQFVLSVECYSDEAVIYVSSLEDKNELNVWLSKVFGMLSTTSDNNVFQYEESLYQPFVRSCNPENYKIKIESIENRTEFRD